MGENQFNSSFNESLVLPGIIETFRADMKNTVQRRKDHELLVQKEKKIERQTVLNNLFQLSLYSFIFD